nr:hypothetical protein [Paenibacillus farraposensis]
MYCITSKGTRELTDWLLSPKELPETEKDAFMLRLYFSIPKEESKRLFGNQIAKRKEKLEHLYESKQSLQLMEEKPFAVCSTGEEVANPRKAIGVLATTTISPHQRRDELAESKATSRSHS